MSLHYCIIGKLGLYQVHMCYYYVANTYDYVGWSLERHNDVGYVLEQHNNVM
jgi:hypothetical protein